MAPMTPQTKPRSFSTNVLSTSSMSIQTPPINPRSTTGLPSFSKSIRSLLPFGPGKSTTAVSYSSPNISSPNVTSAGLHTPNTSRTPFFGSVRLSLSKERDNKGKGKEVDRTSHDDALDDVIAIGPEPDLPQEEVDPEPIIRRSVSYPRLERDQELSADLSTILEADTSGISKHVPDISSSSLFPPSPPPISHSLPEPAPSSIFLRPPLVSRTSSAGPSESTVSPLPSPALSQQPSSSSSQPPSPYSTDNEPELSTSEIPEQVMDALRAKDPNEVRGWLTAGEPLVVDAEEDSVDVAESEPDENVTQRASISTKRDSRTRLQSHASIHIDNVDPDLAALLSPHNLSSRRIPASVPPSPLSERETGFSRDPSPFNSLKGRGKASGLSNGLAKPATSSLPRSRLVVTPSTPAAGISVSVRQPSPERRLQHPYQPTPPSPLSASASRLDSDHEPERPRAGLGLLPRLITPMRHHTGPTSQNHGRPPLQRIFMSPSTDSEGASSSTFVDPDDDDTPSARARPSLDEARMNTERATARQQLKLRMRKRSMSVEGGPRNHPYLSTLERPTAGLRSASSLSNRDYPRTEQPSQSTRTGAAAWLGPRATKAFAAAGLLDHDREQSTSPEHPDLSTRYLYSIDSGRATPSLVRQVSQRSASDYRSISRLGHSERSATPGLTGGRRGSGTYSASGTHAAESYGTRARDRGGSVSASATGSTVSPLMESPTFTDRGRGTPMTTSTAPTSVMSLAGERDRERERDRETDKLLQREMARFDEEARRLRELHTAEMTALLAALADSQSTTQRLRSENSDLRDRLDDAVREMEVMRNRAEEWKWEAETLRERLEEDMTQRTGFSGANSSRWGGLGSSTSSRGVPSAWSRKTPGNHQPERSASRLGLGLPASVVQRREPFQFGRSTSSGSSKRSLDTPSQMHGRAASLAGPVSTISTPRHARETSEIVFGSRRLGNSSRLAGSRRFQSQLQAPSTPGSGEEETFYLEAPQGSGMLLPPASTPAAPKSRTKGKTGRPQHERRGSATSSIFPNVPESMSMLMHDKMEEELGNADDVPEPSIFHSLRMTPSSTASRPIRRKSVKPGHFRTKSVSSAGNVSIISATEMSGSPGNLSLSSEHARHLGDMECFSLHMARSAESGGEDGDGGWREE
ncbi:hypothetical protein HGRIS_007216 [Hohenbuehelia grisea]|uniref:Uncharacterized protein n=1 Tax=Hohenbuehelia grisea TaxID=104357 RepID=A0ABR3JC08_9AGAR